MIKLIKRSMVTQSYLDGGLKMVNLNNFIVSLKLSWIQRIVQGGQSWMSTFKAVFGNIIHAFLDFRNLFAKQLLDKCPNVFWKDVFESWLTVMNTHFNYNTLLFCIILKSKLTKNAFFLRRLV